MNSEAEPVTIVRSRSGDAFALRSIACPTCGVTGTSRVGYRGGRYQRHGFGVETQIVSCSRCGLLFPNPFPFPLEAQKLYGDPDKYFELHDEAAKVDGYRALVRRMMDKLGRRDIRILDVGSGRAELVQAAALEGAKATGLEFSQAMIERAKRKHDIELLPLSIEELAAGGGRSTESCSMPSWSTSTIPIR